MKHIKSIHFKIFIRKVFIVLFSILVLISGYFYIKKHHIILSGNQLALQQQLIFDATFKDEEAARNINPSPDVKHFGFFNQTQLQYQINNLDDSTNNVFYFVYPIAGLKANSFYQIDPTLVFDNLNAVQGKLLITWDNQLISQGLKLDEANVFVTNINLKDAPGNQYYIENGTNDYYSNLAIQTNKEGKFNLIFAISPEKCNSVNFGINSLSYSLKEIDENNFNSQQED